MDSGVPTSAITLLFTDTKTEDEDLYRFIREAAADVGVPLTTPAPDTVSPGGRLPSVSR